MKTTAIPPRRGRRSQDGGMVTEKLHGLMDEVRGESEPGSLRDLAGALSEALKAKAEEHAPQRSEEKAQRKA